MNSRFQRRSGTGWSAIIVVIAITLFGNHFGFLDGFDGRAFDLFHRFAPHSVDDTSVLLVECESALIDRGNPELANLLHQISQASPLAIGVVSERAPLGLSSTDVSEFDCPIVEGRRASKIEFSERDWVGFSELNLKAQPVFRFAQLTAKNSEGNLHSFERLLSAKAGFYPEADKTIGVRFGKSIHAIPRIPAQRILSGNWLPDLIQNRIVIVGESLPHAAGMLTPASSDLRMPRLEARGHTVLTLLSHKPLRKPTLASCVSLVLLFSIGTYVANRRFNYRHLAGITFCACAFAVLISYLAFSTLSFYLPVTALLLSGLAVPTILWLQRFKRLQSIIAERKIWLNSHSLADSEKEATENPWQKLSSAANQFFGPSKLALFELEPKSQTLQHVKVDGSVSDEQIFERARDISSAPWQSVSEPGKSIWKTDRPIFSRTSASGANHGAGDFATHNGDTEFIVPLRVGSKIFGFMVLKMAAEDLLKWPDFENIIAEFSADFTQLIHQHKILANQGEGWKNWILPAEISDSESIAKQEYAVEQSVAQITMAFESDSCCRAMFDAFGNLIKANSRMIRRLDSETSSSEIAFSDLLTQIANVDESEARVVFRNAIVSDQKTELETRAGSFRGNVVATPISWNQADENEFTSRGLLVEIFDASEDFDLKRLEELVGTASTSLARTEPNSAQRSPLLDEIEGLLKTAKDAVAHNKAGTFNAVWNSALFNVEPRLQKKNLTVATRFTDASQVEVRDADLLTNTTEVCLTVLIECSRHSDMLKVQLLRNQTHWVLKMRNGQHDPQSNWTSPSIIGKRQAELLFAQRQKMQACGGSVDVQDTSNGEVVILVSFPAGTLRHEPLQGLEASNV